MGGHGTSSLLTGLSPVPPSPPLYDSLHPRVSGKWKGLGPTWDLGLGVIPRRACGIWVFTLSSWLCTPNAGAPH